MAASLIQPAVVGFIQPALQALTWKFNGTDFWAPIHLDSAVYHLQSHAAVITNSLSKRGSSSDGCFGCTVFTTSDPIENLPSAVLKNLLAEYEIDDVWSAEQFLDCLFIQYNGTQNGIALSPSVADSLSSHGVEHFFLHSAFNATGLTTTASVSNVESRCELGDGPYLVTLPYREEGGLSVTPIHALHPDNCELNEHMEYTIFHSLS